MTDDILEQVLVKKERGRRHYEARKARIGAERSRKARTRSSDICQPRLGQGLAPNHHLRANYAVWPKKKVAGFGLLPGIFSAALAAREG